MTLAHRLIAGAALAAMLAGSPALARQDDLAKGFADPPKEARPRVWWHWMNGNITQDGIDKDLDWMNRIGVAGVQNFDASFGEVEGGPFHTPTVVDKRLVFLTPEWRAAFRHAVEKADAQGFEFAIAGSPGWSESGGPWVTPEAAMKKLVWSETTVEGGKTLSGPLAAPPSVTGPFQGISGGGSAVGGAHGELPSLYRDAAVVAFRTPAAETAPAPAAKVTTSSATDVSALTDRDLARQVELPFAPDAESWVRFDYGKPQTLRSFHLVAGKAGGFGEFGATGPAGRIEASDDGVTFRGVATLPVDGAPEQVVAFPATTARYFRVVLLPRKADAASAMFGIPAPTSHKLAEVGFETGARVHRFADKGGWAATGGLGAQPTPETTAEAVVKRADVVDLTGRLRPDGTLDWTPPKGGQWTILRFGYSLTGRQNHPASAEGTGLEVDKLNAVHVGAYADAYLGEYEKTVGKDLMGARGVQALITDSWEASAQNWTEDMAAQFKARRGYDLATWLPTLAGRVVDSPAASDAFLWDFRKTIGDLVADAHYGTLSQALHARGMKRYGESHETGRAFIGDGMQVKKTADVPMGATWAAVPPTNDPHSYDADVRESASVAHLYGQNLVAAESFTIGGEAFVYDPARLKPVADAMMANGLNRFVLHTSVHQPNDTYGPGLTLALFGQWFTRKETWAEQAKPWIDYLARSSLLLQQGRFVADVAWFYGEDGNITELYGKRLPNVPAGHAYDFVNGDALVNLIEARDGQAATPSGMRYRVLAVDPAVTRMTVPVLRKLAALKAAGVPIVGTRPVATPSLSDDPAEFQRLADQVFTGVDADLGAVLAEVGPDVDDGGAGLRFVHRRLPPEEGGGDLYFVSNPGEARTVSVSFRASGREAEIWRADTGAITPASYKSEGGRTSVPLTLGAKDAVFVVFRKAGPAERVVPARIRAVAATIDGGWSLSFPQGPTLKDVKPGSWTENADPAVRYFSGTATYSTTFKAPKAGKGARVVLDLGAVKNLASVSVNGKDLGVLWKAPFEVDVTEALKAGDNRLEVKVVNLWPNRLIGDKQPGYAGPKAFTSFDPYPPQTPLSPSGLLEPARLIVERRE
ncbi:MAG: glycosyl hydrolase [Caulobacter sp.]